MNTYLVVFLGAALLALVLTPLVVHFARRMNILDDPGIRKVHAASIPRLGGIAIVIPTMLMTIPVFLLHNLIGDLFRASTIQLLTFLGTSLLIFGVGLVDDIWGLSARMKFFGQFLAAGAMCATGVQIDRIVVTPSFVIEFHWLAIPLTLLWIVGITNAVNLIDGLDGLAAGISLITCTVITAVAIYANRPVMAVLMLGVCGSLCGFLVFNFNPAKIFLGDCGSLYLGYMLAVSSVLTGHKTSTALALALPVLALGVPIFDTLLSMVRRMLSGRSPFSPDREHIHHRLLDKGLGHRNTVLVLYAVTILVSASGLAMIFVHDVGQVMLFGAAVAGLLFFFRLSGALPVRELARNIKRNQSISREVNQCGHEFHAAELELQESATFDQWWGGMCRAARALGFASLSVSPAAGVSTVPLRTWAHDGDAPTNGRAVGVSFRMHDADGEAILAVEGVIRRGRSFESAGRRAALFGRLVDRFGVETFTELTGPLERAKASGRGRTDFPELAGTPKSLTS